MTRDDGGPAFPRPLSNGVLIDHAGKSSQVDVLPQCGMSLRDYFAAKAMQAEMITTFSDAPSAAKAFCEAAAQAEHTIDQHLAYNAYKVADAMIAERSKP